MTTETVDEEAAISRVIAAVASEQWSRLASVAEQLRDGPEAAGQWHSGKRLDDGVVVLPAFESGPLLGELVSLLYEAELVTGVFDWPAWWRTCPYQGGEHVDDAPLTDLVRIITSVVRGDRFTEGALAEYVSNGTLTTAVLRLAAAAQGRAPQGG